MGFRRIGPSPYFCLAKDGEHAYHLLAPRDDYRRPVVLNFSASEADQGFPLIDPNLDPGVFEQKGLNDIETKELLEARFQSYPATDLTWLSVHGNNILHILARDYKAEALTWILTLTFADSLRSNRNLMGETPLEALEAQLESDKSFKEVGFARVVMADSFSGFASNQLESLKHFKYLKDLSPTDISRLACGCTCGLCLGGFLSPRVAYALDCSFLFPS